MIFLDANVLLIDSRYQRDTNFAINRQALSAQAAGSKPIAITMHGLLEVVGVMSFQLPGHVIQSLPRTLQNRYRLLVVPNPDDVTQYAGCSFADVLNHIQNKMALGDAVMAAQIRLFAPPDALLLSWNAKHFRGKLSVPVLTPAEWLVAP